MNQIKKNFGDLEMSFFLNFVQQKCFDAARQKELDEKIQNLFRLPIVKRIQIIDVDFGQKTQIASVSGGKTFRFGN